jgi:hypothetical protein
MNPLLSAISRNLRRPGRVRSNRTSRRQAQNPRLYLASCKVQRYSS